MTSQKCFIMIGTSWRTPEGEIPMKRRLMIGTLAAAAVTLVQFGLPAVAQGNYPTKPIRIIVPEVVGSAADLLSRIIGQRLGEARGPPVTYENLFPEACAGQG